MPGLVIRIQAGPSIEESSVTASGEQINIIPDSERASFGIGSDDDLKRAVEKDFGKRPNDAYLKSPTPWGDLYKTYGWDQVTRVLRPKTAEILEVSCQPTILATKTLKNDSNVAKTLTEKISEQVTNTVTNKWVDSSKLSIERPFQYDVSILTAGGYETELGFDHDWGQSRTVSRETTVGSETSVSVTLEPGQSAELELSASTGKMRVRITYEAFLRGCSAVNYNPTYKGHHFWALPIGGVVGSSSNKVQIFEEFELDYYSNAVAAVKNAKTQEKLKFCMAAHPKEASMEEVTEKLQQASV